MIGTGQRNTVRNETLVSVVLNALVPAAIIRFVALPGPLALAGDDGLWSAMLKGAGLATFMMTLVVTLIVRARVRKGGVAALAAVDLPAVVRLLPRFVLLRAAMMAVVAVIVLVPIGTAAASAAHILPLGLDGFALFNIAFGALSGLTMTPAVVLRALADR